MSMFKKNTTVFHEPKTKKNVRLRLLEKSETMTNLVDTAMKINSSEKPVTFDLGTKTDIGINNFAKKFQIAPTTWKEEEDNKEF